MDVGELNKETRTPGGSLSSIFAHLIGESSAGDDARRLSEATHNCVNFPHLLRQESPGQQRGIVSERLTLPEENIASCHGRSKPRNSPAGVVRYGDCLKNHAANTGGNIYDGCGEFIPKGENGTLEALKCAACECHRNFHRKEVDGERQLMSPSSRRTIVLNHLQLPPPFSSPHHHKFSIGGLNFHSSPTAPIVTPMNVAFGANESSSEDLNVFQSNAEANTYPPFFPSKKRFRTKFTQEQKNKMLEFAEKVGWRMQKQDEQEVDKFCAEVGVKRQVLKVWMHNNKTSTIKKQNENHDPILDITGADDEMIDSEKLEQRSR